MHKTLTSTAVCCLIITNIAMPQEAFTNIKYAQTGERELLLDIYMPKRVNNPYLVVWVHGGAWHSGSKDEPPNGLLNEGYALASVDYRLSVEAPFPAMIHDIKASIRYLRAKADDYGYRSDKIIIWGSSAGGHLVALIGTTNGSEYHEGTLGDYTSVSSDVQATVELYMAQPIS